MGMSVTDNSYTSSEYYTTAKQNTLNTWKYQAVSFKDSTNTARAYSNGVMVDQDTNATRSMYSGSYWNALSLMGDCSGAGFKGQADEIRLSNVERNSDWIKVQQLSMTDSLMMYGQEQDSSAPIMGVAYAVNIDSNNDDGNIIVGLNSWGVSGENGSGVNYMGEENNQNSFGYYRFKMNHDIPSMGVSNLKLKVMGSDATNTGLWNSSTRYLKVSMQKSTNSGQITAFNQYPGGAGGITDSTTKVDWNAGSLNWNGTGWNETPNLSTMFNEVRSSYNLQKNNYIQIWVNRGATFNCGASSWCQAGGSDFSSSNGMTSAQLLIEYW
jgi:hypothetical protein